ncbi:MAG: hypothetical protein ABI835_14070 [Chloroflexota bacterium]
MTMRSVNTGLMQALHFTPTDLAANRVGYLTDAQQEHLKTLVSQGTRSILVVAGIVLLIVVGVCVYIVLGSLKIVPLPEGIFGSNALLIVAVMGVVVVFYVIMLVVALSRSRRLGSGDMPVRALVGQVKVKAQGMGGYSAASAVADAAGVSQTSFVIQVGREKIYTTDEDIYRAFQDGITYQVYVVGNKPGYIIVSAEALSAS